MMKYIDEKIINFLTMLTWWAEVRFDVSNRDIAFKCRIFGLIFEIGFFMNLMVVLTTLPTNWISISLMVVNAIFTGLYMLSLGLYFAKPDHVRIIVESHHKKGFPNPEREIGRSSRILNLMFVIAVFFILIASLRLSAFLLFASHFFIVCSLYLYACDDIPPGEKARRKAASESFNAIPSMT